MKQLIAILSLALSFTAQASDIVDHDPVVYGARLEKIYSEFEYMDNVDNGGIEVNLTDMIVTLSLYHKVDCPEGFACIALALPPTIIELPIVSQEVDSCGGQSYTAMVDKTPMDGFRDTIEVVDNTFNTCLAILPIELTYVSYSAYNPWTNETTFSSFKGNQLRLLPSFH
ncbi:MAG: hypothetical protein HRT44_11745 [Bdellovibrionales bacterium]|nr:hypothetical protein [Bdellovibrionales bacterium]NQZ19912.1 hypothetical protein [Bdellovibrionales bacterium]